MLRRAAPKPQNKRIRQKRKLKEFAVTLEIIFALFFPSQVCQAAAPPARPAIHRPQVSGASVLLQADRRHAHRHFPHGDARGSASDHMTPAMPPPSLVHTPAMSAKMKKKRLDSNCKTAYFVLSRTL